MFTEKAAILIGIFAETGMAVDYFLNVTVKELYELVCWSMRRWNWVYPCFFLITFGLPVAGQTIISDALLRQHVGVLSHDSMKGRFTGRKEIAHAANYIASQMDSFGLKKMAGIEESFLIPWLEPRYKEQPAHHVVGIIPGNEKRDKLIIFSAHYDHIGVTSNQKAFAFGAVNRRVKGDSIYNGANDNATGVAAMLELARNFAKLLPAYTLVFVAFSGEELGLLGSADFCLNLDPEVVLLNINLEMLGRPNNSKPYIIEEEDRYTFLDLLNKNLANSPQPYPKNFFETDPFPEQKLFTRSDNYSFHNKGIPSFTIMATNPQDRFYHTADDEVGNIQFEQMTSIVEAIYWSLLPVVLYKEHE